MVTKSRITNRALTSRARRNMDHMSKGIRHHLKPQKSNILRPKQIPIVFAVAQKIDEGSDAVYLDLPTGIGKTVIASQIINSVMLDGWHPKVLIVTYSKELVKQTKEAFEEHAPNVPVGLYYQDEKDTSQAVTVTTYASFPHFAKNFAEQYDYVIYDEGHKALSDERLELMKNFKNANTIALTASPAYTVDKTLDDHFDLAYKMTVPEAIDNDLICSYRNIQVDTDYVDLDKVKLSSNGDYEKKSLAKALDIYSRNKAAVEFYQSAVDPETGKSLLGKRGIVNCVDIQHATNVAKLFNKHIKKEDVDGKIPAAVVHGKMPKAQREKILQDHKDGKILLLVNADLLIEGYDDPSIELCLNLAPSRSIVRVSQRAGRALRLDKNNPDKVALIVDFMDQTSIEKQKGLLYGDVAGGAAYFHPKIEREERDYTPTEKIGSKNVAAVDQKFLKRLKVFWTSKEVNANIKRNRTIREQGSLLGRKQDDELSVYDMVNSWGKFFDVNEYEGVGVRPIRRFLNSLVPVEGQEGQYIDPEDKSERPVIYYGAERDDTGEKYRVLKAQSVPGFLENVVLKDRTRKDEVSAQYMADNWGKFFADTSKYKKVSRSTIVKFLNSLVPVEGQEGQYIDPEDKSNKPVIYYGAERSDRGEKKRVLKVESVRGFLKNVVSKDRKREDELSAIDMDKNWGKFFDVTECKSMGETAIRRFLKSLIPVEGQEGQYIDPEDKNENPVIYYGAECDEMGGKYRVLKAQSVSDFLANVVLKDRKRKNELSAIDMTDNWGRFFDVTEYKKASYEFISKFLNALVPVKGKEGQYIDPEDKSDNPAIYYGTERTSTSGKTRVLRVESVPGFLENVVLKGRKRKDELSAFDMDKKWETFFDNATEYKKVSNGIISKFLNALVPVKGKEGQYIDPEDKSDNPAIYYGAERDSTKGKIRVLKTQSVPAFLKRIVSSGTSVSAKTIFLKDRKRNNELSENDMANNWKNFFSDTSEYKEVSGGTIGKFLDNLIPVKGKEGQYINPEDKSDNPVIYYGAERNDKGGNFRVLEIQSVPGFLENVVLKDQKRKDELSILAIQGILLVGGRTLKDILNAYVPVKNKIDHYIHPSKKFNEDIQIVTRFERGKPFRCLKENCLDILATQNGLEYRDPEMKKKYSKLAKRQPE